MPLEVARLGLTTAEGEEDKVQKEYFEKHPLPAGSQLNGPQIEDLSKALVRMGLSLEEIGEDKIQREFFAKHPLALGFQNSATNLDRAGVFKARSNNNSAGNEQKQNPNLF